MNKQTLLAFGLCTVVLVIFELAFLGPQRAEYDAKMKEFAKQQQKLKREALLAKQAAAEAEAAKVGTATAAEAPLRPEDPSRPVEPPPPSAEPARLFTIESDEFDGELSSRGGALKSLTFQHIYKSAEGKAKEDKEDRYPAIHPFSDKVLSLDLALGQGQALTGNWLHRQEEGVHIFSRELGEGRRIEKHIRPTESYHFEVTLYFINEGEALWNAQSYCLNGPAGISEENRVRADEIQGVFVMKSGESSVFETLGLSKIRDGDQNQIDRQASIGEDGVAVGYVGLASKYFASLLIPADEDTRRQVLRARVRSLVAEAGTPPTEPAIEAAKEAPVPTEEPVNQLVAQLETRLQVSPKSRVEHKYLLFVGPKERALLTAEIYEPYALHKVLEYGYGFFTSFAKFMSYFFGFLYSITGNYGLAILLLTFMVRGGMHPLSRKAQINGHKMQKLGPQIQKLKAKYEGKTSPEAKQKMAVEQMELFRKNKVNPVAGCLPMFIQLPIFFSLYNTINYSYELRQAPFMLWIQDLAKADRLFTLPFEIPFHETTAFSVLPLLVMGLYLLQQKLSPKSADPKQAEMQKMMKFFLPIMALLFYTLPSGLLLYFVMSTAVGILEQLYIRRMLKNLDLKPVPVAAKGAIKGSLAKNAIGKGKKK